MYSIIIYYRGSTNEPESFDDVVEYQIHDGFIELEFEEYPTLYINSSLIDHFEVYGEE